MIASIFCEGPSIKVYSSKNISVPKRDTKSILHERKATYAFLSSYCCRSHLCNLACAYSVISSRCMSPLSCSLLRWHFNLNKHNEYTDSLTNIWAIYTHIYDLLFSVVTYWMSIWLHEECYIVSTGRFQFTYVFFVLLPDLLLWIRFEGLMIFFTIALESNLLLYYRIPVGDGEATLAKSFDFSFYPYIS
jgi:hypothetical protein